MKKSNSIHALVLVLVITVICSGIVYAKTTSTVSCSFNTGGSGNAYVDGSKNDVYHPLKSGKAALKVTSTTAGSGQNAINVKLYKKKSGPDEYYGKITITKEQTKKWSKSVTKSNSYYLFVYGNGAVYKSHTLKGKITN